MAAKGWTQQQLSDASGVRPNTISDSLNEEKSTYPRMETMVKIAEGFGVPLWALSCNEREYALFTDLLKKADQAQLEQTRQQDMRAAIRAELEPMVEALAAKLERPSAPAAPSRPVLATTRKRKHGR